MSTKKGPTLKKNMTASGSAENSKELKRLWDSLTFVSASAEYGAVDYFKDPSKINTKVVLAKNAKHPLKLDVPLLVGAMSTGALSLNAKVAIATGATKGGIAHNTGEGGIHPDERKAAKTLIAQYSTGRFGWPKRKNYKTDVEFDKANTDHVEGCSAIEIKFGQGAKPGQGGLLMGEKVTDLISQLRDIPKGKNCHSPAGHRDIKTWINLKAKVDWLRKISDGLPIIIKFGAGHVEKDISFAVKAGVDIIAIDGSQGGTGASPEVMLNQVGIDTMSAIVRARKHYSTLSGNQSGNLPDLIIGGGIKDGAGIAKALALGASAVFMGFPFMVAMGCTQCKQCWKGKCRKGIATQDPVLMKTLDIDDASDGVCDFIKACKKELRLVTGACGKNDVNDLDKKTDLRCHPTPYGEIVKKMTGVPMSYEHNK